MIRTFFSRALHRQILIWLLAVALPMQAAACAATAIRGPAHVHRPVAGAVALEDFRRAPPQALFLDRRAAPDLGHAHAFDLPQRHPHVRFDASVVKLGGAADAADTDEGAAPASPAAAFVALLPVPPSWHAGPRVSFPAVSRDAPFSSRRPAPPEKPPRAVV